MPGYIKCPHCGMHHNDWWEYVDFEEDDQQFAMECASCEQIFHVEMITTRNDYKQKMRGG